jgi:hypothetical protein
MLVESSIDCGEGDGFGWVAAGRFVNDRFEGERVESEPGAFLGEDDVVQVAKQVPQPLVGTGPGLRRRHVCRPVPFLRSPLPARHSHHHVATLAANLDLGQAATQVPAEAVDAQPAGALGYLGDEQGPAVLVAARAVPGNVDLCSVGLMGDVVHLHDGMSRLEQIEGEVFASIDRMCLRVGELLAEARALDPAGFKRWVEDRMPFGYDKARRLIAIHMAYRELPPEKLRQLPLPWQALYALAPHAQGRLLDALESGEIGPETTQAEAITKARHWSNHRRAVDPLDRRYSTADSRAGALMELSASDLNPFVREALIRWLGAAATPEGGGPVSR